MTRHSFFTTRLASASLLFAMLAGAVCAPAGVANARSPLPHQLIPHGSQAGSQPGPARHGNAAQEWLDKYYLPLPAAGAPNSVYPDATAAAYADSVFAGVNAERVKKGLAPLRRNAHLDAVAQAHGVHMVAAKFFEHESPLGMQAAERIEAAGGPDWTWVGENIAAGYDTPDYAVDQWMKSKGHRHNILNGQFVETGIGVLYDPRSYYHWYWVQVFATFNARGEQVAWVEPRGNAPAGATAVASARPGRAPVGAVSASGANDQPGEADGDDNTPALATADPPTKSNGAGDSEDPVWIPAQPAN